MESEKSGWWHKHGWTAAILLTAFGIAFAVRTIWAGPVVELWGPLYTYAGGSDSYYHSRVMSYIIANHTNLIHDPLLRYPIGDINPREPLFDWMNAILGIVFAPFFGGNANVAGAWFLDLQAPLWAALSVFPTYLIGREVGGRRVGLIAAIISPFLVASINESIYGYANYLSFYTFIILVALYAYMRAVKAVGSRRWVVRYRSAGSFRAGLRNFLLYERSAVKWAVFAGVCFGALALAWQGYTYLVAIIAVFILITMIIERIRRVDSFGVYVVTWIVGLVGFPLAVPYYLVQGEFTNWFDLPLLLFFGTLLLLLPFLLMRDYPWVISLPILVAIVGFATLALSIVSPVYFTNLVTGQGYFTKTLIYSTVAEAQSPSIDQLIVSYGVIAFFLAFVGVALVAWDLVRNKFQRWLTLFLVFGILSLYLPFSASKFLLLGAPAFALLPAFAIKRLWDVGRYSEMRESMSSLAEERRSRWRAFRRSIKPRHVLVIIVVVGLLVPNVWYAMDAGIPSNEKSQYSAQIYHSLPSWLQASGAGASGYYLGAAGSSIDTPNLYDSAAYNWLAMQDTNVPAPQRPAFISWWDYGFQAIDQGQHPAVADNFQNGIDPSGQFLLSQNESIAIGVLIATLLVGVQGRPGATLPAPINQILAADGVNSTVINGFLVNLTTDYYQVINNPQVFLPVNPNTLTSLNAMYMVISYYIAQVLPLNGVAKLYNDLQSYTGWSIRYAMSDSRLFPFSGQNTGIFYAPADLTGRVIDSGGNPKTYFNVTILGSDGRYYDAGTLPATVSAVQYYINYFTPFYRSMIYHIYIGYNGTDIGLANGIPGLQGAAASSPIEPGWMLQHFQVAYKTAYYCPPGETSSNPNCNVAMNLPAATALAARAGGTADTSATSYFNGGESMLVYYAGQPLLGTVNLPNGAPVPGAMVTVYDSWGIPHQMARTSADGSYSVILPPGEDTVNVTTGAFQGLSQAGNVLLSSMKINVSTAQGFGYNTPNMVVPIVVHSSSLQGFVYWNNANQTSYNSSVDQLLVGAKLVFWGTANQTKLTATTDASGSFLLSNVPPGVYNYNILYAGTNYTESAVTVKPSTPENATVGLAPAIFQGTVALPSGASVSGSTVTAISATGVVSSTTSNSTGKFVLGNLGPGNYTVTASGPYAGYRSLGEAATVTKPGQRINLTLVVTPSVSFGFSVTANGQPVAGFPVRFIPIVTLSSNASALSYYATAQAAAMVFTTNSNGVVSGTLPTGNYSIYAAGYVGNRLYSGLTSIHTPASLDFTNPTTLALAPAFPLSGSVGKADAHNSTSTFVIAYNAAGNSIVTPANASGAFTLLLPSGTYTVQAVQGLSTAATPVYTTMTSVSLVYGSTISLTPVVGNFVHFQSGSPINSTGQLYPAAFAMVNISAGLGGPTETAFADAGGSVTMLVAAQVSGGSYCVRASDFGFNTTQQCGITPTGLVALTHFVVPMTPVPVTLTVYGVPAGVPITVNLTSSSPTARSFTVAGGPVYSFAMYPGVYGVGARATIGNSTIFLPPQALSTTILVGTSQTRLSLVLISQVLVTGTLVVPAGVPLSSVTVHLRSALINTTVTGTQFEKGFFAIPGTYSLYATGKGNGQSYGNLSLVQVGRNAKVTAPVDLSQRANVVNGTVVNPAGQILNSNATLTFHAPDLANVTARASAGSYSVLLPAATTYTVTFSDTLLGPGPNGSIYTTYSAVGATCAVPTAANTVCTIVTTARIDPVWFNGTLTNPAGTLPVSGTIRISGPYPSLNVTTLPATNGAFSVLLAPGEYTVYATGGGPSDPLAAIRQVILIPSIGPLSIPLQPTWSYSITVVAPTAGGIAGGTVSFSVGATGTSATAIFTGLALGVPYTVSLPVGSYTVRAYAVGTPYGPSANATVSQTISIVRGNLASTLTLAYAFEYRVTGTLAGPTSSTIPGGATTGFSFRLTSNGTGPETVHFVGSPSYWNFTFSPSTVTLPAGATSGAVNVGVTIRVPAGELVAHPPIVLTIVASNGTTLAEVAPAPIVHVVPYYGLSLGSAPTSAPAQVAPTRILIPFYIANTGNINETATMTVVDGTQLASLGWSYNITGNGAVVSGPVHLAAGANTTYLLNLTARGSIFILPGSVTISAATSPASSSLVRTSQLTVPVVTMSVDPTTFHLVGAGVGSPPATLPDWLVPVLVFIPAIALLVLVVVWRWNRTRRWERR